MAKPKKQMTSAVAVSPAEPWVMPPGPIGAAQAKAHFLSIMDEVKETGTPVIVTRRGKPHVKIVPLDPPGPVPDIFGCMKGTVTITGDIVGPEPDEWDAMR